MKSQCVTVSDLKKIFQSKYSSDSFYEILSGIRNLFYYDYAFIGRISPNAPYVAETLMLTLIETLKLVIFCALSNPGSDRQNFCFI